MRIRSFLVPSLIVLVASACRSTEGEATPATPDNGPMGESGDEMISASMAAPAEETFAMEASAPSMPQQGLDDAADRVSRIRQRAETLSGQYVARGDEFLERADLENALREFANALEVLPSNQTARERMRQVEALMGDDYTSAPDVMEDAVERETIRRAQALISAEQFTTDGDNFVRLGELDRAIESYRRAETILRYHPLIATESLDEQVVAQKLQSTMEMLQEAERAEAQRRENAAEAARMERERQQREYRENKLRTLYAEANAAFKREQYGQAESLAEQILLLDAGNEVALEMRDISRQARHQKTTEDNRDAYRKNWIRTFEKLDGLAIPQVDTLVFDDLERWREVVNRLPYEFSGEDPLEAADKAAIVDRLESLRIRPRFVGADGEGAALEDVATYLQTVTGINFLISPRVRDELDEEETSIELDLPERSVKKVLDIIAETKENLRWKIADGVVKFVTAEELVGGQVLRMYEVRDLIRPITDFPGREINIEPSGGLEPPDEDFEEREALVVTEDSLDSLIRDNVAVESWEADPANNLRISSGTLVVNQTPEVHDQIQKLLDDLREATGIMVDIQARFLKVEDNFLEDIGVDFRGLGAPGLGTNAFFNDFGDPTAQQTLGNEIGQDTSAGFFYDEGGDGDIKGRIEQLYDEFLGDDDVLTGSGGLSFQWTYLNDLQLEMILRAVSKSERVELVTAPRVLVFNTARSNLTVMNQVAYVQDYDVEIAQAASIADPIIAVVQDGVILDVRPVVSADRRFVTLELRPTVAELKRPIRTLTTSLGVSGNSVTIQLPELEVSRVRTSVPMPDGGTVLLGGFKIHESQDLRSGVPILNKIPLISFFFERHGTFVSNRKLLILLKANIVIPQEHEPSPAQLGIFEEAAPAGQ
jgi:type II secretory pathway component GspD/PulD (secretin)